MATFQSDERHWLELHLHELASVLAPAGKQAVLYCGLCEANLAYEEIVTGPICDWPYCPTHQETPLVIRPTSFASRLCQTTGLSDRILQ